MKPLSSRYTFWGDFKMLTKFQLSLLNTFVASFGYLLVPGSEIISLEFPLFIAAT